MKKGTDTFRILHLLGKSPNHVGTRVPSWNLSVLLKHCGLCPEQHPGIKGTSLFLDEVSPLLDREMERVIYARFRVGMLMCPWGQCLRGLETSREYTHLLPFGAYIPKGRQKMDKYPGECMVCHLVLRAVAKIKEQVGLKCAKGVGVGGHYFCRVVQEDLANKMPRAETWRQ